MGVIIPFHGAKLIAKEACSGERRPEHTLAQQSTVVRSMLNLGIGLLEYQVRNLATIIQRASGDTKSRLEAEQEILLKRLLDLKNFVDSVEDRELV